MYIYTYRSQCTTVHDQDKAIQYNTTTPKTTLFMYMYIHRTVQQVVERKPIDTQGRGKRIIDDVIIITTYIISTHIP